MRYRIWALCATGAVLWLTGCNSEDVNNLKNDTRKLGQDIGPSVANTALAAKVNTHLTMHKGIDMSGLHIDTKGKTVTVSGHVRDAGMHKKVIDAVHETTGVDNVVDQLKTQK